MPLASSWIVGSVVKWQNSSNSGAWFEQRPFVFWLFQEPLSNTAPSYYWHGFSNRDDKTLWTCKQICEQHQQANGGWGKHFTCNNIHQRVFPLYPILWPQSIFSPSWTQDGSLLGVGKEGLKVLATCCPWGQEQTDSVQSNPELPEIKPVVTKVGPKTTMRGACRQQRLE